MHVQITLYASKSTSTLALETICFAAVGTAGNYFPTKLTVDSINSTDFPGTRTKQAETAQLSYSY